ncbi:MAG: SLC13 family permease, partial [Planctomycetales bacterium]
IIALSIAGLMVGTRCLPVGAARGAIELQVLLTIGAALGLGTALEKSGATATMATWISSLAHWIGANNPYVLLALVYLMTLLLTELITNTAVAALMFPLAHHVAAVGPYDVRPFVMAIALAASCSFITPIGYQTNLMVMGPGGYRPIDYVRVGMPLTVLVMITAMLLIPVVWPF